MNSKPKAEGLAGKKLNRFDLVRLRPALYLGSVTNQTSTEWVFDEESQIILKKTITYNPGILHLFTEIVSNAIDNVWRSKDFGYKQTKIEIEVGYDDSSDDYGWFSVTNDGYPIPVELKEYTHENYRTKEKVTEMAYPADYFWGEFDSGTNYEGDSTRKSSGLHGAGGKVVVAFSEEVIIDHADPNNQKKYYKFYQQAGKIQEKPEITSFKNKFGYTKVSWLPDYPYFGVDGPNEDLFALIKRHVYECAMITGLKVTLNGETIIAKNIESYVRLYYPDSKTHKLVHFYAPNGDECVLVSGDMPETLTSKSPPQVSWINGINTADGGIHVDPWVKLIFPRIVRAFNLQAQKDKRLKGLKIKSEKIYPWLTLYVRAEQFGAMFESNSKRKMTGYKTKDPKNGVEAIEENIELFDPKTKEGAEFSKLVHEHIQKILKWEFISFIEDQLLDEAFLADKRKGKATEKTKMISDKHVDANMVNEDPMNCNLFICEGTSAHTMASRLIPELPGGKDYWGVFELKGKFLNLMKASASKLRDNQEFIQLRRMTGLVPLVDYTDDEARGNLRYGSIYLFTDADSDGYHIRGLMLSSFIKFWPSLISEDSKRSMIFATNTYVVIITTKAGKFIKGYYSLSEYEANQGLSLPKGAVVRYLKGLGSHRPTDSELYVDNLKSVKFFKDEEGVKNVNLAFGKDSGPRKPWILEILQNFKNGNHTSFTIEGKLSLTNFINNDLAPYTMEVLERAIPSIWDSFKLSQRQSVYGVFQQNFSKGSLGMTIVAGEAKRITEYHHDTLAETITRLGQGFVGSNNIPLFYNDGEFGSRLKNGLDFAAARYLATAPEEVCKTIFLKVDEPVLERVKSEDRKSYLEFKHYAPVIPMVLVNGADGIATGWSTNIPCYNPKDLVQWVREWLGGLKHQKMLVPWYRNFRGKIELQTDKGVTWNPSSDVLPQKWMSEGILKKGKGEWWCIEEIPIGLSSEKFKGHLDYFLTGTKHAKKKGKRTDAQTVAKIKPRLKDVREYGKPNSPRWEILPTKDFVPDIDVKTNFGILRTRKTLTNMMLLNADGIPKKYNSAEEIIEEWCWLRWGVYTKRRAWWISQWKKDFFRQSQKFKFVSAVIKQELLLNQADDKLEENMIDLGFKKLSSENGGEPSFDYLLSMQMRSMTQTKLKEIKNELNKIQEKIDDYESVGEAELWERDLKNFEDAYEKFLKTRKD
jgi:DNA topoisomerase-2